VYDVTTYVNHHPGGEKIFINAGGENTEGNLLNAHVSINLITSVN